jgi:hypothetical protein
MKKLSVIILVLALLGLTTDCEASSLHDAVIEWGAVNKVKDLLNKGANVNAKDNNGRTALMIAATNGRIESARLLIEKGANVNAKDDHGGTALMWAASGGHTEIARLLIEKGADIDFAIIGLEGLIIKNPSGASLYQRGIRLIERVRPKQEIASQPQPSPSITKEELKTIVQAAVEGAKTQKEEKKPASKTTDIDKPSFTSSDKIMGDNDIAVIIGIEGYQNIPKSNYSYDDAKLVKEYVKALGFKERNIELLTDEKATKSSIEKSLEAWLKNKAKPESRIFVYYSGHGAPDPTTGEAYLVPYDGDPNYLEVTGYSLKRLYEKLGKLQVKEITVVLDSCFSGAGGRSVLAKGARPLVMTADIKTIPLNLAILSATQGAQISTSSAEKGHGVFTYYFLKALKEGKKTIAEIYEYIKPLVEDEAKQLNVQQSPSVSPDVEKIKGRFILRR